MNNESTQGLFWIPFHSGDFLTATAQLSVAEVGIYSLLMAYQIRYNFIPKDETSLRNICKKAKFQNIQNVLKKVCHESEKGWLLPEVCKHKLNVLDISAKRAVAGKKGAESRWKK